MKKKLTSEFVQRPRHIDLFVLHTGEPSERRDGVLVYLAVVRVRLAHTERRGAFTRGLSVQPAEALVVLVRVRGVRGRVVLREAVALVV